MYIYLFYTVLKYKYEKREKNVEGRKIWIKTFELEIHHLFRILIANNHFTGIPKNAKGRHVDRMIHWLEMVSHGD